MRTIFNCKRIFCAVLLLAMLLSMLPTAFAAEEESVGAPSWGSTGEVDDPNNTGFILGDFRKLDVFKDTTLNLYFLDEQGRGLPDTEFSLYPLVDDLPGTGNGNIGGFEWRSLAYNAFTESTIIPGVPELSAGTRFSYEDLHSYAVCIRDYLKENAGSYSPAYTVTTNGGKAVLSSMQVGLYLVVGETEGVTGPSGRMYSPEPFILCMPTWDMDEMSWTYSIDARVKYSGGLSNIQFTKVIGMSDEYMGVTVTTYDVSAKGSYVVGEQGVGKVVVSSQAYETDTMYNVYLAEGDDFTYDSLKEASDASGIIFYEDKDCTKPVMMPIELTAMGTKELFFEFTATKPGNLAFTAGITSVISPNTVRSKNDSAFGYVTSLSTYGLSRPDPTPAEKEFQFKVRLTLNGMGINGTYTYNGDKSGEVTFVNGEATISLAGNRNIIIYGIPAGCEYTFSEVTSSAPGYTPDESGASGSTGMGQTSHALIINNPVETARVKVHKSIPELVPGADESFTFTFDVDVSNADAAPNTDKYRYHLFLDKWVDPNNPNNQLSDYWCTDGYITSGSSFTLTAGQYIVITGVPFSAKLNITESESGYAPHVYVASEYVGDSVKDLVITKDLVDQRLNNIEIDFQNMRPDGPELPATGSEGIYAFVALGMTFVCGGFILAHIWRRRFQ